MEVDKKNREELKSYFVRNAIPTEGNFSALIDAMLNQREDGVVKPAGHPLSIEGSGDDTSRKEVFHLYRDFADAAPSWVLSLNPRRDPGDPATGLPGFNISDGAGHTRFFIDRDTGSVGVGTLEPRGFQVVLPEGAGSAPSPGVSIAGGESGNASVELRNAGSGTPYIDFAQDGTKTDYDARIRLTEPGKLAVEGANVGIGTAKPEAKVTIQQGGTDAGATAAGKALFVSGPSKPGHNYDGGVEFRHDNLSQGIGFGYQAVYATGSNANQPLHLYARGSDPLTLNAFGGGNVGIGVRDPVATLDVKGVVRAEAFESTSALDDRMYPADPVVYQEIFDAMGKGAIAKLGNPTYDDTTYRGRLWNGRHLVRYGADNERDVNGAKITIPAGYDTVWVRVLGDRWTVIKAYFLDGKKENLGLWAGGHRPGNCCCPDGSLSDGYHMVHQWMPIPAGRAGQLALIAKPRTNSHFWLSGVAFSKNPWAHAVQSAVGYHWASNGGNPSEWATGWENWNSDSLSKIGPNTNLILKVPVVPSGRDKLVYVVEHNNNWNGCMHNAVTVNGKPIERFLASYDNPFARHWNSKFYNRYIAARIPKDLIPAGARHLDVRIDMTKQDHGIHFREIGTHDLQVPRGS